MRWLIVVVAAAGCGRFGFQSTNVTRDGLDGDAILQDGSAPQGCNAITRFADDFADGVDAGDRWAASYADPGNSHAETGGEAVLTLAPNTASSYTAFRTSRYYDLRGHRMSAEVTQLANGASSTGISIIYDANNYLHLVVKSDNLAAVQMVGGSYLQLKSAAYDVSQRFWAIEEQAGQIVFSTSSDGTTFTPFHQTQAPFDVSLVRAALFAGTDNPVADPGSAHFTSYNGGVAVAQPACPIATEVDHFTDGVIGHDWEPSEADACCMQVEANSVLQLSTNGAAGYTARNSSAGYELREGELVVAVPSAPTGTTTFYGSAAVHADLSNSLELQVSATQFTARVVVAGSPSQVSSARQAGETQIRIRDAASTIHFEVSADKVTWRTIEQLAEPFPVDDVTLHCRAASRVDRPPRAR